MIRLLILLCWAFVSCAPSLNSTPPSEMTKNVSRETSFEELAKRSSERLQMPFLLGGEDVSALYLEWEDMFRTYEDELLALWFEKLPAREKGAIWHFVQGLKEKKKSHPRFVAQVIKHRSIDAPALSVTDE
jgi:hypothetical protein